jgi:hypothetical protein
MEEYENDLRALQAARQRFAEGQEAGRDPADLEKELDDELLPIVRKVDDDIRRYLNQLDEITDTDPERVTQERVTAWVHLEIAVRFREGIWGLRQSILQEGY